MTMLSLFNPILPVHQIVQYRLPFHPISNGAAANTQNNLSRFTIVCFSSAASNSVKEIEDPVLDFFHSYGFTHIQIKRFNHKCPSFRSTVMIKPKFDHLLAFGFSPSDLVKLICYDPNILVSSLKKRLKPNLGLLEATLGSKSYVIKAVNNRPNLLTVNHEKIVIPKVKILRETGIPMDKIAHFFIRYPLVLRMDTKLIIETIDKLKGLGMSPSTLAFVHAMDAMLTLKKETWERKMELYRSFGWSEKDTLSVFSRQPMCLQLSEAKIKKHMNFFTEKLEWDSALIAKRPIVLMYSLEGRIIPRCAVLNVLAKKKLWEGKPNLYSLLIMAERNFEERFVAKYKKEVPQVIDAYAGKVEFTGFDPSIVLNQSQARVGV